MKSLITFLFIFSLFFSANAQTYPNLLDQYYSSKIQQKGLITKDSIILRKSVKSVSQTNPKLSNNPLFNSSVPQFNYESKLLALDDSKVLNNYLSCFSEDTVLKLTSITFTQGANANFSYSTFNENAEVDFSYSSFTQDAKLDFTNAQFKDQSIANFSHVKFGKSTIINFSNSCFKNKTIINFLEGNFQNDYKVNFKQATLSSFISFKSVYTQNIIDLSVAKLDSNNTICSIDLAYTDISKFKFNYTKFNLYRGSDLEIDYNMKYINEEVFGIDIDSGQNYLEKKYFEIQSIYEQILKMQKKYGYKEGYEKADKELQDYSYRMLSKIAYNKGNYLEFVWYKFINFLEKFWWDYGYQKSKVFYNTFCFLFLFSLLNTVLTWRGYLQTVYPISYIMNVYDDHQEHQLHIKIFKYFYTSILYTSLIFFGLRIETSDVNYKHFWGVAYIFFQYAVGLVCLAYLTNIIIIGPKVI